MLVSFSRTVVFGRWIVSLVRIRGVVISGVVAGPGTVTVMTVPGSRGTVPPRPSGACAPLDRFSCGGPTGVAFTGRRVTAGVSDCLPRCLTTAVSSVSGMLRTRA